MLRAWSARQSDPGVPPEVGGEAEFGAPPLLPPNRNSPPGAARVASQLSSFQGVTLNGAHTKSTEALCSAHGNERVAVAVFTGTFLFGLNERTGH